MNETKTVHYCANRGGKLRDSYIANNGEKYCNRACENIRIAVAGVSALAKMQETQIPLNFGGGT